MQNSPNNIFVSFCIFLIKIYQKILSPLKPRCCRFNPSCSSYAIESIKTHGIIIGIYLIIGRILRCNPFFKGGDDFVPKKGEVKLFRSKASILTGLCFIVIFGYIAFSIFDKYVPSDFFIYKSEFENQSNVIQNSLQNNEKMALNTSTRFLVGLVRFYKEKLSPLLPGACRYHPSCSNYSIQALKKYGALKGTWLTVKRILRCNPWGGHGEDPVP